MSKNNSTNHIAIVCIILSAAYWIRAALSKPLCSNCKWMIPNKSGSLCGVYKTKYDLLGAKVIVHEYAEHCRNNESLCGKEGYLYESVRPIIIEENEEDDDNLSQELEELFETYLDDERIASEVNRWASFYEAIAR